MIKTLHQAIASNVQEIREIHVFSQGILFCFTMNTLYQNYHFSFLLKGNKCLHGFQIILSHKQHPSLVLVENDKVILKISKWLK